MKNFGEFYNNQIESAGTIVLSRTQKVSQEKLEAAMDRLRGKFGTDVISYGAARPEKEEDPLP